MYKFQTHESDADDSDVLRLVQNVWYLGPLTITMFNWPWQELSRLRTGQPKEIKRRFVLRLEFFARVFWLWKMCQKSLYNNRLALFTRLKFCNSSFILLNDMSPAGTTHFWLRVLGLVHLMNQTVLWKALWRTPLWEGIDYHWLSLIIIDYHWLSLTIIDFHWLSLIIIDYLKIWKAVSSWLTELVTTRNQEMLAHLTEKETKIFTLWILDQNCGWTPIGFQYLHDK